MWTIKYCTIIGKRILDISIIGLKLGSYIHSSETIELLNFWIIPVNIRQNDNEKKSY